MTLLKSGSFSGLLFKKAKALQNYHLCKAFNKTIELSVPYAPFFHSSSSSLSAHGK